MRIGVQAKLLFFVTDLLPPNSCEGEKEALLWRKAVNFFVPIFRMFIERFLERGVSELHAADVRDVLTLSKRAVYVQSRQRFVFVILLHNRIRSFLKFLRRLRCPPIGQ